MTRTSRPIVLARHVALPISLVAMVFAALGCKEDIRSLPHIMYELDGSGSIGAPAISAYLTTDGFDDCVPGEQEEDFGLLFPYQRFSPPSASGLKYQPFAACTPDVLGRYFVGKTPEVVFELGDDLDGCVIQNVFELRLAGRWAASAGFCADGSNSVIVSERTGVDTWAHDRRITSGGPIDAHTFDFITGFDFKWTGSVAGLTFSYVDTLGSSRLAYCPGATCLNLLGPGDIPGVVDYLSPKIGGAGADTFVTFQTTGMMFGPVDRLYYSLAQPGATPSMIAQVGTPIPSVPGETVGSFGNFLTHEPGETRGAFTASTSPSGLSVGLTYDVTDSLSLRLEYKTDDDLPDTTDTAESLGAPSFDGDFLSIRSTTNLGRSLHVTEFDDGPGMTIRAGYARSQIEAFPDYTMGTTQFSNDAVVRGIGAFQANLTRDAGVVPAVLLQDIERIEVVRGLPAVVYGSDAVSGVVNFITGPDTGFDVDPLGSTETDFGAGAFDSKGDFYLGARLNGNLFRWNRTLGGEEFVVDTGIDAGFAGLAFDSSDNPFALSASVAYSLDPQTFAATELGSVQDAQGQPVLDLSGLTQYEGNFYASRRSGAIGQLDFSTTTFTLRTQIVGLPADLESITQNGQRAIGGLADGRLIEVVDCLDGEAAGSGTGPPQIPTELGFTVLGMSPGSIPAVALMTPEPSGAVLASTALLTLAAVRGRTRRRLPPRH